MTRSPEIFWKVISVFDPEGAGSDFAYTVGLTDRGLPEMHLWARPSEGHDPGEDWSFNPRERGSLLNEFALEAAAGRLHVGDTVVREFDGGAATVEFRLDPPVDKDEVDAFQAATGAQVIPIRWTLTRAPEGPLTGVADADRGRVVAGVEAVTATLDPDALTTLPAPWRDARAGVSLDPNQPYGPLTSLVLARGALVATADADTLVRFCHHAVTAENAFSPRAVIGMTLAQARPVGRTSALKRTLDASRDLAELVIGKAGPTRRWREVVSVLGGEMTRQERDEFAPAVENLFAHAVAALLSTSTLEDVLDADVRLAGYGPWAWSATADHAAPQPWQADEEVLAAVSHLLGDLNGEGLLAVAEAHAQAFDADESGPYATVTQGLLAQAITSAAGAPSLDALLAGTPAAAARAHLAADPRTADAVSVVEEAVAAWTSALAHPDRLRPTDRAALIAPFLDVVPELGLVLARRSGALVESADGPRS